MANETWKFVQAKSKQAMKQMLEIRDEKARMKVTPPLAVAPLVQEDGMRWNPKFAAPCLSAPMLVSRSLSAACDANDPTQQRSFSKRTTTTSISTRTDLQGHLHLYLQL